MNWNRAWFRVLLLTGVLILPFLGLWEPSTGATPASGTSFVLTLQHDHLSAAIENLPLRDVLDKLSRLTGLEVSLEGSVGDELVSIEFKNLPLEDGIRRILQGKSYALTYAESSNSRGQKASPRVIGIRVVPKGAEPSTAQENTDSVITHSEGNEPDEQRNAEQEQAREALAAADVLAESKERANEKKEMTLQEIVDGLKGKDPSVRESAMDALKGGDGPVPLEPLSEMALKDSDPFNRMDALTLLAVRNGQAAVEPLEQALQDPDPNVSELAHGLLEDLKKEQSRERANPER